LRRPTQRDTLWAYLAFELNEPSLCDKIPPHAYVSSGLFGGSLIPQIGLYRSECYLKVAERYGLQNLCDKVISIRTAYAASEYSTKNCHKKIADNKGPNSSFGQSSPDDNELISFFDALGYSPETLHLEGLAPPLSTVIDDYQILIVSQAYYKLAKEKDILERITRVTASSAFPIEQKEFLYSMAAVVARDGNWCQKIRGDIHATGQYPVDRFFRDECVTDFAYAANNPTLCSEIPNRPQYRTSFSENIIRDECRRMIEIHWNSRGDYRVPLDKNMRMAMITALGYPAPNIKEFPDHNIAEYYLGFIAKLTNKNAEPSKNGEASAWQGAHEKFLKRAYALN